MRRRLLVIGIAAIALTAGAPALAQRPADRPARPGVAERQEKRRARVALRIEQRFRRLDADGNGAISRDEWPRRLRRFDRLDVNHDGRLTMNELTVPARLRRRR